MFRRRIYAQAFTILAMAAGSMYWQEDRNKRKEFEKLQSEKAALEKRDAWLRELEARDEEEKARKAKLEKRKLREAAAGSQSDIKSVLEPSERRGVLAAARDLFYGCR